MTAIRFTKYIDSETPHLPELREMVGKTVEITVLDELPAPPGTSDLSFFTALAPKDEKALSAEEIEGMRVDPEWQKLWPLLDVIADGGDFIDPDAIAALRASSLI